MAMPDYGLGTRQLGNIGNIGQRTILWEEAGRHVQQAANATAGAFLAADHYQLRQDEKSAHAALAELNGLVQADWIEAQKMSWQDLEDAKTTPADKMNEIVRKAQNADAYKRLNPRARRMFEESWKRKQIEYGHQAQVHAFNLARQKDADNTKTIAADIDNSVKTSYLADDATFTAAATSGAARQAGWMVRSSPLVKLGKGPADASFSLDDIIIEGEDKGNPQALEIRKRINETMRQAQSAYVLDRAKTLADLAATAQPGTENFLKVAEEMVNTYSTEKLPESGEVAINEQQKIAMKAYLADAKTKRERTIYAAQTQRAGELEQSLTQLHWDIAGIGDDMLDLAQTVNGLDDQANRAALQAEVDAGRITQDHATKLQARFEKIHADAANYLKIVTDPTVEFFPKESDAVTYVQLQQMITDAERNRTAAGTIESAIELARTQGRLSRENYLSLWKEGRKKRNQEDDRIINQVFAAFAQVSEDTAALALDKSKRGTKAQESAMSYFLEDDTPFNREGDYTVNDVDDMVNFARRFIQENPGKAEELRANLEVLMRPISEKARARTIAQRIQTIYARQASEGALKTWNIDLAVEDKKNTPEAKPKQADDNQKTVRSLPGVNI